MTRAAHGNARARRTARAEDRYLGIGPSIAYGLQHVLTMYGGIVAVPLIIGQAADLPSSQIGVLIAAALFMGGLATLVQTIGVPFFGSQLPLVQGVSFASVSTMVAIVVSGGGLASVLGAVMVSAAIGFLIAPFFSKVIKFLPPVVTGSIITTIGLTLMPVAAHWAMGGNSGAEDFGSVANIGLAALTLALVLLLSKVGVATISRLSILIALVLGTLFATVIGMADFSQVGEGPIFELPQPFFFGVPEFHIAAIISMVIVVIVILTETTADIIAVGEIVDSEVDSQRIANGLRADMGSSFIAPIFGSFTQSAFAQNVGLVAVTGVKSRFVVAAGGVILVLLGLLPIMGRVVAAVPTAVLGGAGLVLFGTVAASGIRTLAKVEYHNNMNLIIVATSIGFGMIPIAAPSFYDQFPDWFATIFHSGISSSAVMAIILNLLFNHMKLGNTDQASVFVAGTNRSVREQDVASLNHGDHFVDGKLFDVEGEEVPIVPDGASEPSEPGERDDRPIESS